ncbi:MAG: dCTP deaminase, partial [Planctomycetaceae bacterium]|nr:dCTP deaminase [Planctomycetaceae bacterium]
MILSGLEILKEIDNGNIVIDPFDQKRINPNSYNLRLHNELMVYQDFVLDMRTCPEMERLEIPAAGIILKPNQLYLGRTAEYTLTRNYVPMLEGRSSVGRLGLYVHVTAGFGDVGFAGFWTLEIQCIQP